jgi:hypothetical protein
MKIGIYSLCKNEAKNIDDWWASIGGQANYVVVKPTEQWFS